MNANATLVLIDSAAWVAISATVGLGATLLPGCCLDHDRALTRVRTFEQRGRVYRNVLRVHHWKDALPEVHNFGVGTRISKARLPGRAMIDQMLAETRRAEYVHFAIAFSGPLFLLWNPRELGLTMILAGVAFNLPFIVVQRYNRARMLALTSQRRRVRHSGAA